MPLTGFFRGYCRRLPRPSRGAASQQEGRLFFPLFLVSKMYGTPPLHAIKYVVDKKAYCVWSYSYVPTSKYIACTRVQTMSICSNLYNTTLGAPGTQPLAMLLCGFFWGSDRNNYYLLLVLVMRLLATSISMYVRVPIPKFNK